MRRSPLHFVLGLVLLAACGGGAPPGPVMSPTGIVYDPGTPPRPTRTSQTATLYLRQDRYDRALDLALEGIDDDPGNPIHYFLAGAAYARLDDLLGADSMFTRAEEIYPAYELEVEPEREAAWGAAFNAGLQAYEAGHVAEAIETWRGATALFDLSSEAHRNLGSLLAVEGRYDEAIEVYQDGVAGLGRRPATRVLSAHEVEERRAAAIAMEKQLVTLLMTTDRFAEAVPLLRSELEREPGDVELRSDLARALEGIGEVDEAERIYGELLAERGLEGTQLFNLGVALFRSADYEGAAEAFRRLTESQPGSRDAWFNYANALFAAEEWLQLATAGDRLIELEPLGENAMLITARAQLESGDRDAALGTLARAEAAPVYVEGLRLRRAGTTTEVEGRVTGNVADAGTLVRLRFVFFDEDGRELGSEPLELTAPPAGESEDFAVSFAMRAVGYRYEVAGAS